MIFSVQRFLEDYLTSRGYNDPDQYSIALATAYSRNRTGKSEASFLGLMKRIKTAFFKANPHVSRQEFERAILSRLDGRFKKKEHFLAPPSVVSKVEASGAHLYKRGRVTIRMFLEAFKHTIEAEAINSFWESRAKGKLRRRPEKLAQDFFGVFASTKLESRGAAIREAVAGVGFVDVLVTFSSGLIHVVELKMLHGNTIPGPSQLAAYMQHKKRKEGWLLLLDVRKVKKNTPSVVQKQNGTIRVIAVDLNPTAPSHLK